MHIVGKSFIRFSQQFLSVTSAITDGILILDHDLVAQFVNEGGLDLSNTIDISDLENRRWVTLWPEDEQAALHSAIGEALSGARAGLSLSRRSSDGSYRLWDLTVGPFKDGTGATAGVVIVSRERTFDTQQIAQVHDLEQRRCAAALRGAAHIAGIGVWEADLRRQRVYFSSPCAASGAGDGVELAVEEAVMLWAPEHRDGFRAALAATGADILDYRGQLAGADQAERWLRIVGEPVVEGSVCVGWRGAIQNTTTASGQAAPVPPVEAPARGTRPLQILVAEDNAANRLVIRTFLQTVDIEPTIVLNGHDLVAAWAAGQWDVILTDIQMPVMDGATAAGRIRRLEIDTGRSRTPIVAITANCLPEEVASYEAAGIDAVVPKPVEFPRLLAAIDGALDRGGVAR